MKKALNVTEWHKMANEGKAPPVRIVLKGFSMNPLIRGYQDHVTILPNNGFPKKGDIVLFCEPGTGRYVVHRVWEINDDKILTWGDNCSNPDGWFPLENIWGRVALIERGKKTIHPNPILGMRWAEFWHRAGKVYRLFGRYKAGIMRRIKIRKT